MNKNFICNVCNLPKAKLTRDHVPAKGAHPFFHLYQQPFTRLMTEQPALRGRQIKQNGVLFERACSDCNCGLIRHHYDPAFINFIEGADRVASSEMLIFFNTVELEVKPVAVVKGILGHLMSARDNVAESNLDKLWRATVLNPELPIPPEIHVYYWYYPYPNLMNVFRDLVVKIPGVHGRLTVPLCSFVSCFPIAFVVTDQPYFAGLLELTSRRQLTLNDTIRIPLRLDDDFGPYWPVKTDHGTFALYGASGSASVSAERRMKNESRRR